MPVPTSSTVSPGLISANSRRCAATGVVKAAVGANDAHISRWRVLIPQLRNVVTDVAQRCAGPIAFRPDRRDSSLSCDRAQAVDGAPRTGVIIKIAKLCNASIFVLAAGVGANFRRLRRSRPDARTLVGSSRDLDDALGLQTRVRRRDTRRRAHRVKNGSPSRFGRRFARVQLGCFGRLCMDASVWHVERRQRRLRHDRSHGDGLVGLALRAAQGPVHASPRAMMAGASRRNWLAGILQTLVCSFHVVRATWIDIGAHDRQSTDRASMLDMDSSVEPTTHWRCQEDSVWNGRYVLAPAIIH